MRTSILALGAVCAALQVLAAPARAGDDPFADQIVAYDQGANPAPGYTDPSTALCSPERFTGEGVYPSVVSPFSPPFGVDEIVSIGAGGHLVVRFDTPVTDDPANPFGIDLLIFGNTGFLDADWPNGVVGGALGNDGGAVEVSADGIEWLLVSGVAADGLLPTAGYLDAGPYDAQPGSAPSAFTRPVEPGLTLGDLMGLSHEEVIALYAGAGGGSRIDLAAVGLAAVSYVRITNPGDPATTPAVEIDALSDVTPGAGPADIDNDGVVGVLDFLQLLAAWGPCPAAPGCCPADVNGDRQVSVVDFLLLLGAWGP
ncbi:MAG: hypothetical protein ACYSWT_16525 [Planctomycetota bacterium]|jgi:hypothetical protein